MKISMSIWYFGLLWVWIAQSNVGSDAITAQERLEFAKSHNKFSMDLYKMAAQDVSNGNLFFSPLGISYALGLLKLGAKGWSLDQLNFALHVNDISEDQFHSTLNSLSTLIHDSNKSYSLNVANKLILEQSHNFLTDFLEKANHFYGSSLDKLDFENDAQGASDLINEWVSNNTNGKINNVVSPEALKSSKLVLVNVIYFKGQWYHPFSRGSTEDEDFHLNDNENVKIPFMKKESLSLYRAVVPEMEAEVLELPFTDDLGFYIVLPNRGTSLNYVEAWLSADILQSLRFQNKLVTVWLPRFKLDTELKLKDHLRELGVGDIFNERYSDLSGINGNDDLFVSEARHKAFIDLNEEGVEAAAYTGLYFGFVSSPPEHVEFKADRPFFFYLKDKRTNMIYFMGRFLGP